MSYTFAMSKKQKKGTDYFKLVSKEFAKLVKLRRQRDDLDAEIAKSKQFIAAAANMLVDSQREFVLKNMALADEVERIAEVGLTEAIKSVLKKNYRKWLTVTQVRDELKAARFDFSAYKSNPLASIATTLKRLRPEEVESTNVDGGVAVYRWTGKILGEPATERIALRGTFLGMAGTKGNLSPWIDSDPIPEKES